MYDSTFKEKNSLLTILKRFRNEWLASLSSLFMEAKPLLKRTLTPLMLWGLGVGYVISGMYFGWNLGLPPGGTGGMAAATLLVVVLYVTFTFGYAELACAIPKAGGVFDYAAAALGPKWAFVAGWAQIIEFVFAPPAIAAAIGAYLHIFFTGVPVLAIAVVVYVLFTALNIVGVKAAALVELAVTLLAVAELLLFAGVTLPHFSWGAFTQNAWPHGWQGAWAAIPFAIWFFLGLEGLANVAEETINPQRQILRGFAGALATLVLLCLLTFLGSIGVAGWEAVVYAQPGAAPSDSPLPLALAKVTGSQGWLYRGLVGIGLLGLVASFHGIVLAAGRASFEFGRVGHLPSAIGRLHPKFKTPSAALLLNMVVGVVALLTGKTGDIIIMACFGALTLYGFGTISVLVLRKTQPGLHRPYKMPFYPLFPRVALALTALCLLAMISVYWQQFLVYLLILVVGYALLFRASHHQH